jgi:hypothetical protein
MNQPAPRPALRKAADGSVHPASTRLSSVSVTVQPTVAAVAEPVRGKKRKKGKKSDADLVELVVSLPRGVRRELRKRAQAHGWTAEEAATHVLRAWAEG